MAVLVRGPGISDLLISTGAERELKPATTCMPAPYLELVVAGFSPRSGRVEFLDIRRSELGAGFLIYCPRVRM